MINQIVQFNVKLEYHDSFKAALIDDKKNAEQEAGYVEIRLFEDKKQPNLIFSYERWRDQDALDYHREHPYTVKICQLVDTSLASQVEILNLGCQGSQSRRRCIRYFFYFQTQRRIPRTTPEAV